MAKLRTPQQFRSAESDETAPENSVESGAANKAVLAQPKHGWSHLAPPCEECDREGGKGVCNARYHRTGAGCRFFHPKAKG